MNLRIRVLRIVLWTALVTMISIPLLCATQSLVARWEGYRLLNALAKVRVGVTTEAEMRVIFHSFHADDQRMGGRIRQFNVYGPGYTVTNSGLSILHLAPPARFGVSLFIDKGIVVVKNAGFTGGNGQNCCVVAVIESLPEYSDPPSGSSPSGVRIEERGDHFAGLILVHLNNQESDRDRRAVYNFDLSCLTAIRGCADANNVLPDIERVSAEIQPKARLD